VSNVEAVDFYKKFGFQVTETIAGYYKRLDPSDCFVLSRSLKDWAPPDLVIEGDDVSDRTLDAP
jgi:ribosomal protein S18 acetylase RimI-like enzyme